MSTRRGVILGIIVIILTTAQHLWRTMGKPEFAKGDQVVDMRTGARGVVTRYHRWPYRHYVVVFDGAVAAVRPEHLTRAK